MTYRVTVNDAGKVDHLLLSVIALDLSDAKNVAWILQKHYPHDIVQYEEIRDMSDPATTTTDQSEPPLVIAPEPQRKSRQRVCRVEIPDEIHHVAALTGQSVEKIIADLIAAQVSAIRSRAKSLTSTAGI